VELHYFFRGTPLLVQMFMLYYGLGQMQFEAVSSNVSSGRCAMPTGAR
jgi:ABC-type arginine/histidine transport system permease subunit